MAAPSEIEKLVERFDRNREQYLSPGYNETELRQEFLNPFFSALGWDIENRQGYAEPYKDVIHEDAIKVGSATKAPDYSFRIGGMRKFFVEAKRPSVRIKEDAAPAFQLRRYAWSAKLPLSLLTDFEEFAVYDCRIKPTKHDSATVGRVNYLTFVDYIPHWDDIASVFSREAVLTGSFDKYAESAKGKKGTTEVDDAFLKEIESWRDQLARNIAIRNPKLTQRELNFAVQKTIDRIIFLRICEDRGIETYGSLMSLVNGERTYKRLCEQFYRADEKYNSGLFHFQEEKDRGEAPDSLTLDLHIDDKPLIEIIGNLYYPDCPYEFSVLPADILGQVYEQFLGKVIRLTAGHQAKVEDKPEVKKAGGVYYTPTYIVDYIVKNTVGKLVEGKTPKQIANIHVLDPACGSGSFLIGAYQYLLNWHRDWYVKDGTEKWAKGKNQALYQGQGGDWRLTTAERKRILLNNIYGVDIDSQAVEVTKLSLLLKVLEGENEESITQQLKMFHERALPDLGSNIKCGNSLIGPDFYNGGQLNLLDDDEKTRINVFDWKIEFKAIMDAGGFDVVIGNPPYGATLSREEKSYIDSVYRTSEGNYDSFSFFIERGIACISNGGHLGFIVPDTWFTIRSALKLREFVLKDTTIREIQVLNEKVFLKAKVDVCTILLQKGGSENDMVLTVFDKDSSGSDIADGKCKSRRHFNQTEWLANEELTFNVIADQSAVRLQSRLREAGHTVEQFFTVGAGVKPYEKGKGAPPQTAQMLEERTYTAGHKKNRTYRRLVRGSDIGRYAVSDRQDEYISYGPWLAAPRDPALFVGKRLLFQSIRNPKLPRRLVGTLMDDDSVNNNSLTNIIRKDASYELEYLLGLLNSALMNWYFATMFNIVNIDPRYLKKVPFIRLNFENPRDKSRYDRMISLVESMLQLHKDVLKTKTDQARIVIQRQIDATDKQIDALVYELYGLTEEEIRIVESPQSLPKQ
jgi:type I restriction-modification system DNA methylase subunit